MNPDTGVEVADGEIGENIVTTFANTAQPLLNYRSHDLVRRRMNCSCGRTWVKFEGSVLGRSDFMLTVRGTNVYQTAVENLIGEMPEVSNSYELVLTREEDNDIMTIRFEPTKRLCRTSPSFGTTSPRASATGFTRACTCAFARLPVAPGSMPRYELKTKRIIDQRPVQFRRALDR